MNSGDPKDPKKTNDAEEVVDLNEDELDQVVGGFGRSFEMASPDEFKLSRGGALGVDSKCGAGGKGGGGDSKCGAGGKGGGDSKCGAGGKFKTML